MTTEHIHGVSINGGRAILPDNAQSVTVSYRDGRIISVSPDSAPTGFDQIEATGLYVAPGLIDLQVNGGFGYDLSSDPASMWDLARILPSKGVTSFLPTFVTGPASNYREAINAFAQGPGLGAMASIPGLHFEGPMVNRHRAGAHNTEHLREPDNILIDGWTVGNGVLMVTIAPELPGALAIISELAERGVVVSAGHSTATAFEGEAALGAGTSMVTHLFNAMDPMGHRSPGLVGLTLARNGLRAGLIVDGIHVDPLIVAAAWNAKGPDDLVLVSDSVALAGLPPGQGSLAGRNVSSDGLMVCDDNGVLAGSMLTLNDAVRNLISFTGCSLGQAIGAASRVPADVIRQTNRGSIAEGMRADIVMFDKDLNVEITICEGHLAYVSNASQDRISNQLSRSVT